MSEDLYLVKVPTFIYQYLCEASINNQEDIVVGTIDNNFKLFKLNKTSLPESLQNKPSTFDIRVKKSDHGLKCLTEDGNGNVEVVGDVSLRGDVVPVEMSEYATMIGEKTKRTEVKTFATKQENVNVIQERKENYKRRREEDIASRNAPPEQAIILTKDEMVTALLSLFNEAEYWTKREIMKRTNQKDKIVTEALKELTIAHTSGPHKSNYSLKPEFKINAKKPKTGEEK